MIWLDHIPESLRERAAADLQAGDVIGFLGKASNEQCLELVRYNEAELRTRGLFERALLQAFIATRTNNHRFPLVDLRDMFARADRERLRRAGDPLPGPGPFTLYRGVAGSGRARRIRGLSWTASQKRAAWFAARFANLPDPAVVRVTVDEPDVLAYLNDGAGRSEQEFLVLLSPDHRVVRVPCDVSALATLAQADKRARQARGKSR